MHIQNVEFKARVENLETIEELLLSIQATFVETQHQIDTYFNTSTARLKLREAGENHSLIHYDRANTDTAKESDIIYYQHLPNAALKSILTAQLGVKVIVDKIRTIYAIDNVRFHLDIVQQLGTFVEVEAMNEVQNHTMHSLKEQCDFYFHTFKLQPENLIDCSYSDLLLDQNAD